MCVTVCMGAYLSVTVRPYQTLECTRVCVMSLFVFVVVAVSYLSVSVDILYISGIRRPVPHLVCVYVFCLPVFACVCVCLHKRAYRNVQECECVRCRLRGHQQVLISSDQTRQEGSGSVQSAAVCCVAVSNLGHGLGLQLNEK